MVIIFLIYLLIGCFFGGAIVKILENFDKLNTPAGKIVSFLLYLFFWPVLIAIGLGMRMVQKFEKDD